MRIVIAGGSGFIGKKLTKYLAQQGHELLVLTRNFKEDQLNISYVEWLNGKAQPEYAIKKADVFINLAGASINEGRWTKKHQKEIYTSRMTATDELLRIIDQLPSPPKLLINASAIGIYPSSETTVYTEESKEVAHDFLGQTVAEWEQKAMTINNTDTRVVCTRFGVILGTGGGALPPMVKPYHLFVGGTVGSGRQWLSWIHIQDVIRAIEFIMHQQEIFGPVNVTAPYPKRMKEFGQTIATTMKRPHWLPVPATAMRLLLGKKSALVLTGQHVIPKHLLDNGFKFTFSTLEEALQNLIK